MPQPIAMVQDNALALQSLPDPMQVLIVEDNRNLLTIVCELLTAIGHVPFGVTSAEEALPLLASNKFNVLLTDVRLPGMSGIDLAKKVNQDFPELKVIIASGLAADAVQKLGLKAQVLPKPYDLNDLQIAFCAWSSGYKAV
ncbi:MAG: response regulator [Pseudomonadota bacterium]